MVRSALLLLVLVLTPSAFADPLRDAKAHLAAGAYDKVVADLDDGRALKGRDKEVAAIFTEAALQARGKGDHSLAGLYCELALTRVKNEKRALKICLQVALEEQRLDQAEAFGERLAGDKDPEVPVLRAQVAALDHRWERVLQLLSVLPGGEALPVQAQALMVEAEHHLHQDRLQAAQASSEARLQAAEAEARKLEPREAAARAGDVTLYSTSWCGYCRQARGFLEQRGVAFTEKDIEKDPGAREEMQQKCRAARKRPGGVPVLDVKGSMIMGFDPAAMEAALR